MCVLCAAEEVLCQMDFIVQQIRMDITNRHLQGSKFAERAKELACCGKKKVRRLEKER